MLDIDRLIKIADANTTLFKNATPFKYAHIENFFGEDRLNFISKSFPSADSNIWKETNYKHTMKKSVLKTGNNGLKDLTLDQEARDLFYELNSSCFLNFLERLSGINGLFGDPYLAEAGFHLSRGASSLAVHADFSHHDLLKLERRLNFIYYLSPSYDDPIGEYDYTEDENAVLCLYSSDLSERRIIKIKSNSAVIFETFEHSYHGFPEPTNFSADRFRRSIAMYYYTVPTERVQHRIIFPEDPNFVYKRGFGSKN